MALGVDSSSIDSARTSSYTWRRGDVLVTALVESGGAASSVLPYASALTRLDDVLDKALSAGVCADQTGGADQATRSPYLNRGAFKGLSRVVEATPRHRGRTARQLATAKVVPVPPSPVDVPEVGTLPQRPVPAPTTGPLALPATVPFPEQPVTPTEPQLRAQVDQQIEDPDGPGCGWAFTDQVAPRFDEDAAQRAFDRDFNAARDVLDVRWRSWQHAKAAFYTAWAEYLEQVDGYGTYAAQVAKVRRAWDVIDAARADYYTAYENWQTEVAARDAWFADRAQARADYQEARQACRDAASATPTPTPTASSSPGDVLNPPGASPSADPSLECPPARPAILDEVAPTVGPSPKPAAEAQLP